jgi:hypothetical protein
MHDVNILNYDNDEVSVYGQYVIILVLRRKKAKSC